VAPHSDIVERLRDVPPSARVRGLYFKSVGNVLREFGKLAAFEEYFPAERHSSLTFYPLADYLLRLAVAGALTRTPGELHEGIREITRQNSTAFASSLLGRVLIRILDRDPIRLTEQGLAARRQSTTYGGWQLVRRGPSQIEVIYRGEYLWIESAIAGAAMGTFESCRVRPRLETTLIDKYNGATSISW
jgi:uncharacterized protein (TIGR02265 family)